jgi:signal transduction histidine kinase
VGGTSGSSPGRTRLRPWSDVPGAPGAYPEGVQIVDPLKRRMEAACERAGFPDYAWWIPLVMNSMAVLAGFVAVGQRVGESSLVPVAALMAVALAPWVFDFAARPLPWAVHTVITSVAALTVAIRYPTDYDFSIFVLVMLTGHLGAVARPAAGLLATVAVAAAVKLAALTEGLEGSTFWIVALVVGWDVGFVMQYQQRRLTSERRAQADHEAQAVLEERQRIAREVHDVIAHSLSVTMLHLTAARRSLEEDGGAGVEEAVDALRDAERQGREAMTDIRRTVGLLGQEAGRPAPAPDLRDLPALVEGFRTAGLDVGVEVRGEPADVPTNTGLGLYRIVQESLANVAKHEPAARVVVALDCDPAQQQLRIRNTLNGSVRRQPGGSGLKGMRERAQLLGGSFDAGVREGQWVVDVTIPGRPTPREHDCALGLSRTQADPA